MSSNLYYSFELLEELFSNRLVISSKKSISYLVMQCNCPLEVQPGETCSAISSITKSSKISENDKFLATFRFPTPNSLFEVMIYTVEGYYGILNVYVVFSDDLPQLAEKICIPMRALSLYRLWDYSEDTIVPQSKFTITGTFSLLDLHYWLDLCLSGLPEKPKISGLTPAHEPTACVKFVSVFLGTRLKCSYSRGRAEFWTENFSTLATLQKVLTKEATIQNIPLHIDLEINSNALNYVLKLINPKMEKLMLLSRKANLVAPLRGIEALSKKLHDITLNVTHPDEYAAILKNADSLEKKNVRIEKQMERLYGTMVDLYVDEFRFQGFSVEHKIPELLCLLDDYNLQSVINFFNNKNI